MSNIAATLIVLAACMFVNWLIGMVVFAGPMIVRMRAREREVGHYLQWREWVVTFTLLPLAWPFFFIDLYFDGPTEKRRED